MVKKQIALIFNKKCYMRSFESYCMMVLRLRRTYTISRMCLIKSVIHPLWIIQFVPVCRWKSRAWSAFILTGSQLTWKNYIIYFIKYLSSLNCKVIGTVKEKPVRIIDSRRDRKRISGGLGAEFKAERSWAKYCFIFYLILLLSEILSIADVSLLSSYTFIIRVLFYNSTNVSRAWYC